METSTLDKFSEAWAEILAYPDDYDPRFVQTLIGDPPRLVKLLTDVLVEINNDEASVDITQSSVPIYIFLLAGYLGENSFAKPLLKILHRDFEETFPVLPFEFPPEIIPLILARIVGSDVSPLKDFICDKSAHSNSRDTAMNALVASTALGLTEISDTQKFFLGLFTGTEDKKGSDFWSHAFMYLCDLGASSHLNLFHDLNSRGMINKEFMTLKDLEKEIRRGDEYRIEYVKSFFKSRDFYSSEEALHETLSGWLDDPESESDFDYQTWLSEHLSAFNKTKQEENKINKNRKRKKLARKSKKKNRR